jgi:hypothetical protein
LTPEYWLAEEAQLLRQARGALDQGAAFDAGYALGVLRTRAHLHGLHLRSVTRARAHNARLRKAGEDGTKNLRKGAEVWRRRALELAEDLRQRRPDLNVLASARSIVRALASEGYRTGRGMPPSERSVRRAIAPLWGTA